MTQPIKRLHDMNLFNGNPPPTGRITPSNWSNMSIPWQPPNYRFGLPRRQENRLSIGLASQFTAFLVHDTPLQLAYQKHLKGVPYE